VREGIDWRYIDFVDNQEVLDLVEGRMGLLDLLDEQCRFPTVRKWLDKCGGAALRKWLGFKSEQGLVLNRAPGPAGRAVQVPHGV